METGKCKKSYFVILFLYCTKKKPNDNKNVLFDTVHYKYTDCYNWYARCYNWYARIFN